MRSNWPCSFLNIGTVARMLVSTSSGARSPKRLARSLNSAWLTIRSSTCPGRPSCLASIVGLNVTAHGAAAGRFQLLLILPLKGLGRDGLVSPTLATVTSSVLVRRMSPMPQTPKERTRTMNRILKTQEEALERMSWSMATRLPTPRPGPSAIPGAARGGIIGASPSARQATRGFPRRGDAVGCPRLPEGLRDPGTVSR